MGIVSHPKPFWIFFDHALQVTMMGETVLTTVLKQPFIHQTVEHAHQWLEGLRL